MLSIVKLMLPVVLSAPALVLAQSGPVTTHAQAHENIVELKKAGYSPLVNDPLYPRRLQQAEATLSRTQAVDASYGSDSSGTVQSGK